jgi:hypothetical protein
VPTATSALRATSGVAGADGGGDNTKALRVIEIATAAIAIGSAAAAYTLWRRRKERL